MSKVLFFGLPVHGHTGQALGLARELVERGEEVIYYSNDAFAGRVRSTGAGFRSYRGAFLERLANAPFTPDWLHLWMEATEGVLAEERQRVRADEPDYIIYDGLACWGRYLSRLVGVPAIASISTLAFNPQLTTLAADFDAASSRNGTSPFAERLARRVCLAKAAAIAERLARRYGSPLPAAGFSGLFEVSEELNIVYTSRLFQPFAKTFDERFQFVGRAVPGDDEPTDLGAEEIVHSTVVYVSLGTIFNRDPDVFRMCFDALAQVECQAVVSTGRGLTPQDLGEPPPNVLVRSYVPQVRLLERCAACITNGGLNTVSDSLYQGVPLVAIPFHGEQSVQARRLEELGAGVCLPRSSATSSALRDALRRVLGDARAEYVRQCERIGDSLRASGGVERAVDHILAFSREARRSKRAEARP